MRIEIEEPFKAKWSHGYLETSHDGRKQLKLRGHNGERFSTPYARYVMGVKLGYEVPDHLEVDHRDDDKTNDVPDNLQLLTGEENKLKEHYRYIMHEQKRFGYICACCGNSFILIESEVKKRLYTGVEMALCGVVCSKKYQYTIKGIPGMTQSISEDKIEQIKQLKLQGLSGRKIAIQLKIDRDTVYKYW